MKVRDGQEATALNQRRYRRSSTARWREVYAVASMKISDAKAGKHGGNKVHRTQFRRDVEQYFSLGNLVKARNIFAFSAAAARSCKGVRPMVSNRAKSKQKRGGNKM